MIDLILPRWLYLPSGVLTMLGAALLGVALPAQARESIDLAWALQQTLANNIELASYPQQQARAEALRLQAGLRPSPTLDLSVENAFGSGDYNSLDSSETTLSLGQVIELGNKRQQRIQLSAAGESHLQTEYELTRLDVLAETSRRYYQLLAIQQRQVVNSRRIEDEKTALASIRQRANAGAIGKADVAKMDLRLARSRQAQLQLLEANRLARLRLAAMWQGEPDFEFALGELDNLPPIPRSTMVISSIDQSPALLKQLALQRLSDARLQVAIAEGRSDLNLSLGVRHFEASDDQALVMSFSMPLAFRNPNRGRIAAARAEQQLSQARIDLNQRQLTLALLEIQQQLESLQGRAEHLQSELLPRAKTLLDATGRGYQLGQYGVLEWTDAQAELFSLEHELIELQRQIYLQLLELERITGQPMITAGIGDLS